MKHFCIKLNEFGVKGESEELDCAISLPERWCGCRNAGFGPNFTKFLFPDTFWVEPYPSKQKKGGTKNFPLKDFSAWASRPQTVQWLMPDCNSHFSLPKGVHNRTFTPDPRTFTKMSPILLQTPLVSCWHQRGAFGSPLSDRDFHPAHLGTSRHKLSVQGCLVISS